VADLEVADLEAGDLAEAGKIKINLKKRYEYGTK